MEESRNHPPKKEKDGWDRMSIGADIVHKIFVMILGTIAAGIFYLYQQQQVESRYFADLMAQRESAETQLRAQMFKTLFDAYFANKLQAKAAPKHESSSEPGVPGGGVAAPHSSIDAQLEKVKQEAMFTDLLSRNFESVDVRPLFEDLDAQLSALLYLADTPTPVGFASANDARRKAFTLREQLRRIAIGASSRQATALTGGAHATVTMHYVEHCRGEPPELKQPFLFEGVNPIIDKLKDGTVTMRVVPPSKMEKEGPVESVEPVYLQITFYDMPSLENIVLPSGKRVAFTLSRYISYDTCSEFKEQLDETIRSDCDGLLSKQQACDMAVIRAVVFPEGYIGVRDRPYLNDLVAGKFRRQRE